MSEEYIAIIVLVAIVGGLLWKLTLNNDTVVTALSEVDDQLSEILRLKEDLRLIASVCNQKGNTIKRLKGVIAALKAELEG